ncbi:conserved hypothetical protein [Candidatus Terasakiella magnetica]|uniref:Uncharacterized protein n=1 Tax=Candidatus Terasakiella magnetica TaxID=1867952 RepID=A0A1C3RDX9_9PROT|nr:DUF1178 family protein [Candidatus Terasakiella magnetica]SCA55465.1 conserved hypothetical protein [Candidatus Terasakiella magnetica]
MIKYTLQCSQGHVFEDWFASSSKFDEMSENGEHSCPECGSSDVAKTIMAPNVANAAATPPAPSCGAAGGCSNMGCPAMQN